MDMLAIYKPVPHLLQQQLLPLSLVLQRWWVLVLVPLSEPLEERTWFSQELCQAGEGGKECECNLTRK